MFKIKMNNCTKQNIWEKIQSGIFIVAEIGKNFIQSAEEKSPEEYLNNAKQLIKFAKESGADAVKFQTHNLEDEHLPVNITSTHFPEADRYNWIKRNERITSSFFLREVEKYCEEKKIIFFSTPMSRGAAMKLEKLNVCLWKIGSADILDFVMLDFIAGTKKPIIISSGMSTLEEIDKAVAFLINRQCKVAILHCVTKYPCPAEELNLKTIDFLKDRYKIPVGFSDHSIGYHSALAAVNMGAKIIEKHFSLSRDLWGSDHKVSLIPKEFKEMTYKIKERKSISLDSYGDNTKLLNKDESVFRPIFRKSLVVSHDIKEGTVLTKEKIYAMRPQKYIDGLPSEEYEKVLGKKVNRDLKKYTPIKKGYLNR